MTYNFATSGTYSVELVALNGTCPASMTTNVDVVVSPTTSFTVSSAPCSGTYTFESTSTGATSYEWKIDGVTFATSTNLIYNFSTSGTYQVELIASNGGCSTSHMEPVTVDLPPDANFCRSNDYLWRHLYLCQFKYRSYKL